MPIPVSRTRMMSWFGALAEAASVGELPRRGAVPSWRNSALR